VRELPTDREPRLPSGPAYTPLPRIVIEKEKGSKQPPAAPCVSTAALQGKKREKTQNGLRPSRSHPPPRRGGEGKGGDSFFDSCHRRRLLGPGEGKESKGRKMLRETKRLGGATRLKRKKEKAREQITRGARSRSEGGRGRKPGDRPSSGNGNMRGLYDWLKKVRGYQ